MGRYNVRCVKGKEVELVTEIEVLGITKTKKKGNGMNRIHKAYWLFWSGVKETEQAKCEVCLIVTPNRLKDITKEKNINERL